MVNFFTKFRFECREFISFLKNPKDVKDSNQTAKKKITRLVYFLIFDLLLGILSILINLLFEKLNWINSVDNQNDDMASMPFWLLLFSTIIIAPLLEELIFRYPLRFKSNIVLNFFITIFSCFNKNYSLKLKNRLKVFWSKKFGILFYLSAILFGLIHLTNYNDLGDTTFILWPILILSQLFAGVLIGYLRIKHNLFIGFCLHAFSNAILILTFFFTFGVSSDIINEKNENFSLQIKEINFNAPDFQKIKKQDTLVYQNQPLRYIISQFYHINPLLIDSNKPSKLKSKINLEFINLSNLSQDNRNDTILKYLAKGFKFSTKDTIKPQSYKWLRIIDSTKIMNSKSHPNTNNRLTLTKNKVSLIGASFKSDYGISLAGYLESKNNVLVLCDTIKGKYNFEFPTNSKQLIKTLGTDYGIEVVQKMKNFEFLYVKFDD